MNRIAFPKLLSSQIAFDIARTILDGFNKHYRLFRAVSQQANIVQLDFAPHLVAQIIVDILIFEDNGAFGDALVIVANPLTRGLLR